MSDEPAPPLDLNALLAQIAAGAAGPDTVVQAVSELVREGKDIPLELEAATLEIYIAADPDRLDLKQRLASVIRQLGREIDPALLAEVKDSMLSEEYQSDFQALLDEYGRNVRYTDMEQAFTAILNKVRPYTMTTVERLYALWSSAGYLCEANLAGDIVECGVWRGGSMMTAALELVRRGRSDRELWLYDTFAGMPKPHAGVDVDALGNRAIDGWENRTLPDGKTYWAYADEPEVHANMASTSYPADLIHFVPGLVEDTIPATVPQRIALLRIDTDWYASYKHILQHLYDRVVPNGIVIFDDYGHFMGARKAVDEFRSARGIASPMLRVKI